MTINQLNKNNEGGRWLVRERQQGNHTTTTVGNEQQRECAADGDSNKEGKDGKGDGNGNKDAG
jgi:hypothetical protein